jgi:hypothetical protein
MFSIIFTKFLQNKHLAVRLLCDTGTKPIWHIDTDGFWGTSRILPDPATDEVGGGGRTGSAGRGNSEPRAWYVGDNWNGKILCVVRTILRTEITMDPQARRSGRRGVLQIMERELAPRHADQCSAVTGASIIGWPNCSDYRDRAREMPMRSTRNSAQARHSPRGALARAGRDSHARCGGALGRRCAWLWRRR